MNGPNKFGLASSLREHREDCDHEVCLTCGDVAVEMKVVRFDGDLAVCEDAEGDVRSVEVALLDAVEEGDMLLVHADVALVRV
jgi:hypothetical protein